MKNNDILKDGLLKKDEFDPEDDHGANRTAQISIMASLLIYLCIFILVAEDMTKYTLGEFMTLASFYIAAIALNVFLHPVLEKKAPKLKRDFLMAAVFIAVITLEAYTQMLTAVFLSFPIMLACRYHDRRFLGRVIVMSFIAVVIKEWFSVKIGMFDLNVIQVLDNTLIEEGVHLQVVAMKNVNMDTLFTDVLLYSVLPKWVQLTVISVVAAFLEKNGRTLRDHQKESIRREAVIESELESARDIQMGLLPYRFDIGEGFDLYASSVPAKNVGGDFYDCFMVDDRHLAVIIADVSGKGMPAALFMATTKMCMRDHVLMGLDAGEAFTNVNRSLCEGNAQSLFVTAWMGILDLTDGTLNYVNAGHNPPLVMRKDGSCSYLQMKRNIVLGAFRGFLYRGETLTLSPGDSLFLYTDGVTESQNVNDELYGDDRLEKFVTDHSADPPRELIPELNEELGDYAGEADQFDDITMLSLRFRGLDETVRASAFPAEVRKFHDAEAFIRSALDEFNVSEDLSMRIIIAAYELFSNVAAYAYPNNDGDIGIRVIRSSGTVSVSFADSGIPFDPLMKKATSVSHTGEHGEEDYGITKVLHMMDEVRYSYVEKKNIVTVVNRVDK